MDWNKNPKRNEDNKKAVDFQRAQRVKERRYVIISIILLIIGFVSDVLVLNGYRKFSIVEFDNISLAIVQAQAGISTLTIAILALMGNQTNESYLGVRLNDFLLNKKPIWFTQKRIIGISLMAIFFNFIFHMAGLYNLVVMTFLVACLIVWISVDEVYEAFSGVEKIEEEIKTYVLEQIEKGDTQSRIKVLDDFCKEWKKKITLQGNGEYEEYTKIFEQIFAANFEEDSSRKILVDQGKELAGLLLKDTQTAERGIVFVQKSYENAWVYIQGHKGEVQEFKTPFWLFNFVFIDVQRAIERLTVQELEYIFDWDWFTDIIVRINLYINYKKEEKYSTYETQLVENFSSFLGYYISNKKGIRYEKWYMPLNAFRNYGVYPESLENFATEIIARRNFRFIAAQIKYDYQNSLIDYFYNQGLSKSYLILDTSYAIMVLKVHCYIYYLAYCETIECIDQEQIERCRSIIKNETVKKGFQNFLSQVIYKDKNIFLVSDGKLDVFNNKLETIIYNGLEHYEEFPKNGEGKVCVMDSAVSDFVIFLTLYLAENNHKPQLLERVIVDTKAPTYYARYVQGDRFKELQQFYEVISKEEKPERILKRVETAYALLKEKICDVYKHYTINNFVPSKEEDIEKEKSELKNKIEKYFVEKFGDLIDKSIEEFRKLPLLQINIFTEQNLYNVIDGNYEWLFLALMKSFLKELINKGKIRRIRKTDFKTDEDYLEYLRSKQQCVIIGSESRLYTKDFRRWDEAKDIIKSTEHYTIVNNGYSLILDKNSFHFNIQKIRVGVHAETIQESGAVFDPEDKLYTYEPIGGVKLKFKKDELEDYLKKKRRVVNIVLHIGFKERDGIIGDVIMDK